MLKQISTGACRRTMPLLPLLVFVLLGAATIPRKSPTFDEAAHIPAGYYYLKTLRFGLYNNNPPLSKVIAALPLVLLKPAVPDWEIGKHWPYALTFQFLNRDRYAGLFTAGRLMILALGVLLGLGVYAWAGRLFGRGAAALALLLFSFSPNMLAHATLVTPDMCATLFIFLTMYALHKHMEWPTSLSLVLIGACFGCSLLSKFTALLLLPLLALTALLFPARLKSPWKFFLAVIPVSILVLNAGYLFEGCLRPFHTLGFRSEFFGALPGWMRAPLPSEWLRGLDEQLRHNRVPWPAYFLGTVYPDGGRLWYYEAACCLLKTSLPVLVLGALGAWFMLRAPRKMECLLLLAPMTVFMVFFSLVVHQKIGLRYLLPVYPFLFIVAGRGGAGLLRGKLVARSLLALLVVWHVGSSLAVFPDYLTYFNESIGRNRNGYKYLVDSNLDWGQDLPALRNYMKSEKIDRIKLSYFGTVDPVIYGINYDLAWGSQPFGGWYAVSATHLAGVFDWRRHPLQTMYRGNGDLGRFNALTPARIIGNSILVYHLKPPPG